MQVQSLGQEDPLDKKMATHSVLVPGKSHGQRGLGGYSPWDPKGGRHNSVTKQQQQQILEPGCTKAQMSPGEGSGHWELRGKTLPALSGTTEILH